MNLLLRRQYCDSTGVYGILYDGEGVRIAVTLEHSFGPNWRPAIIAGQYQCVRGHMNDLNLDTFEVTYVPNHTKIFIHPGNTNADSAGCILIGTDFGADCITQSRVAFNKFLTLEQGINEFTLYIQDPLSQKARDDAA